MPAGAHAQGRGGRPAPGGWSVRESRPGLAAAARCRDCSGAAGPLPAVPAGDTTRGGGSRLAGVVRVGWARPPMAATAAGGSRRCQGGRGGRRARTRNPGESPRRAGSTQRRDCQTGNRARAPALAAHCSTLDAADGDATPPPSPPPPPQSLPEAVDSVVAGLVATAVGTAFPPAAGDAPPPVAPPTTAATAVTTGGLPLAARPPPAGGLPTASALAARAGLRLPPPPPPLMARLPTAPPPP